jgi:hypothetical protein
MSDKIYRIHPGMGVARVGNAEPASGLPDQSTDHFFIGPELPGVAANFDSAQGEFRPFKLAGKVKRQAARFRVWEYERVEGIITPVREVNLDAPDVVEVRWTVHLANRKASFFEFDGPSGEANDFAGRSDVRNHLVPAAERAARLEIDPRERSIGGVDARREVFENTNSDIPIRTLGEIRTDDSGRLLVLGGLGEAGSSHRLPPPHWGDYSLGDYANNDAWFDDVSDGPVRATLIVRDEAGEEHEVEAEPAWVLVAPPDFAPAVGNIVTLNDVFVDLAVREMTLPADEALLQTGGELAWLAEAKADWQGDRFASWKPSFRRDIAPLFLRTARLDGVLKEARRRHTDLEDLTELSALPGDAELREDIFDQLRDPEDGSQRRRRMPRLLGDRYEDTNDPERFLPLTRVHYAMLRQWSAGKFVDDWSGAPAQSNVITPAGLDRAALEHTVGGGFFPGIEASWLIRNPGVYRRPWRVEPGTAVGPVSVGAGFFSQQMALPWHADFWACKKEVHGSLTFGWWPGQRPDDVYVVSAGGQRRSKEWTRGGVDDYQPMVDEWSTRGFVVQEGSRLNEREGP